MFFSIIEQTLIALPLIMGAYLTLSLLKLPDFSLESAYLFGAVMAFLARDFPFPVILLSALGGGMIVGGSVSLLNRVFQFPFLLAAIVTNGLFHGATQYFLGTSVASFRLNLPLNEGLIVIPFIGFIALLSRSQLGYALAIYGNNTQFFYHHNLSGSFVLFSGVMIGHSLAGISGFLFAQSNGFVDLTMNFGIILFCLTALMMGKLLIRTNHPNLFIPLLGIIAYFAMQQTLLRVGFNLKYFNAFQALMVLWVLFFGRRKQALTLDHLGV